MRKYITLFIAMIGMLAKAQELKVVSGTIQSFKNFPSNFVDPRTVAVWLPDGYTDKQKYPVIYMQDGQMLFDPDITWNKQAWQVDKIAGQLIADNKIKPCIIVGIWNNRQKRHPEYFPQREYNKFPIETQKRITDILIKRKKIDSDFIPLSDNYLKFIVTELKPFIDQKFATKKDRENTFIAGSSMGGLASLYAICEYPKVFGRAACLSTHWTGIYQLEDNPIPDFLFNYLKKHLPNPKNHKIYFDYGDQTLDALYPTLQQKVDKIMIQKGYTSSSWITKSFPGKDHSEKSWSERFNLPLEFLLGNK